MRAIIISMNGCSKCASLKAQCPDAECVTLTPDAILQFAREINVREMPFVVLSGEISDLTKTIKGVLNDK